MKKKPLFLCIVLVHVILAEIKRADDNTWAANLLDSPYWTIRDSSEKNGLGEKIDHSEKVNNEEGVTVLADHAILFKIPQMESGSWVRLSLELSCELHNVTTKLILPHSQLILDKYCNNHASNQTITISMERSDDSFATVNGELLKLDRSDSHDNQLAIEVKRASHKISSPAYFKLNRAFVRLMEQDKFMSRVENNKRQTNTPIPDSGNGWIRFFYDDFNGTSMDTDKWDIWGGVDGTGKTHYNRSLATTGSGWGILRNQFLDGVYSSTGMTSIIDYSSWDFNGPSRWDVRIKIPKSSAVAFSISLYHNYSIPYRYALADDTGGNRTVLRSIIEVDGSSKNYYRATNLSNFHTISLILGPDNATVSLDGTRFGAYDTTQVVGKTYFLEIKTLLTCDPAVDGACLADGPSNKIVDLSVDWVAAFYAAPPTPPPPPVTPAGTSTTADAPVPADPVTTSALTTGKKKTAVTPMAGVEKPGPSKGTIAAAVIVPLLVLLVVGGIVGYIVLKKRGYDFPTFSNPFASNDIPMTNNRSPTSGATTVGSPYTPSNNTSYANNSNNYSNNTSYENNSPYANKSPTPSPYTPPVSNNSYNQPPPIKRTGPPPNAMATASHPVSSGAPALKSNYNQVPSKNAMPPTRPGPAQTNSKDPTTTPYMQMHPISTQYQPGALTPNRPHPPTNGAAATAPNQMPGRPYNPNSQSTTNVNRPHPARTLPASMSDPGRIPGRPQPGSQTTRPGPGFGRQGARTPLPEAPRVVQNCNIDFNDVEIQTELGRGAFGVVHMGLYKGTKVAVKQVILNTEEELENFTKEINLMMSIRPHTNVIQLLGVTWDPHAVVTEFMPNGSLNAFLFSSKPMSPAVQRKMIVGIAKGMAHLHKEGIIHRDLAARNVLLAGDFEPQISDFGLSRINKSNVNDNQTKSDVGPLKWMAPESLNSRTYSFKSDVWAYGVTVMEILSRDVPYPNEDALSVAAKVMMAGYKPSIPPNVSPVLIEVLKSCFQEKPAQRSDFSQIAERLSKM